MYPYYFLSRVYRVILNLTRGRGEHTLAKVDAALFPKKRNIPIGSKASLSVPPDPHFFRYLLQSHEIHIKNAIIKLCKPGDVVLDIGANIGYFVACAADCVGKSGIVLGFEPEPQNFKNLEDNCILLDSLGFQCKPYKYAISSGNGIATLNIHRNSTYHTIDKEATLDRIEDQQSVSTITLDEWSEHNNISHIDFLKIDTEGHEKDVLLGANKLFGKGAIDYTILECRTDRLSSFIDNFAKEFNLHQLVWNGQSWLPTSLSSLDYKTECLLSCKPISPDFLL